MNRFLCVLILMIGFMTAQTMVIRVYCNWNDLERISPHHCNLDIAAGRANEWYDIVADRNTMDRIIASGLPYEVQIYSLELEKEKVRGQYYSYDQYVQMMRTMAQNYPSICKFDSLPVRTHEGRWIYGVKISDNPNYEDPTEPGFLIDGCHHAREWATAYVVYKFCDSITKVYSTDNEIRQIVDNIEIYAIPVLNADGYVYDYPNQRSWRKNREPFGGSIGTDPNRNYGCCVESLPGQWGAVDKGITQASHYPSEQTFCGAYAFSGNEIQALTQYARTKVINAYMSYHSYSEYLLWGWGWTTGDIPDGVVCARFGNRLAGMINKLGGGTYTPGQIPEILYHVSGASIDWFYSWFNWVGGIANLSYTTEIGTSFYQPVADLDHIFLNNFKALKYLAQLCRDSIGPLVEPRVAPPQIYPIGNVGQNFTIRWHPVNPAENHPTQWELVELSNPNVKTDSLESGSGRWLLNGFNISTAQYHSPTRSLFSGNTNNMNNAAQTLHPYIVQPGDSFSFWCYYNLQANIDVAVVEISENTKEWFSIDTMRFTGTQTSWVRKAYSLANWVGKSVYFRFRCMTDGYTTNGGFYVDDISPVCLFGNVNVIANNITDTAYTFTNHPIGEFYYYVRGYNIRGWGDYSSLAKADVEVGINEGEEQKTSEGFALFLSPNPFQNHLVIKFQIPEKRVVSGQYSVVSNNGVTSSQYPVVNMKIFDVSGKVVKSFNLATYYSPLATSVVWDGKDDTGRKLPSGVYFVHLESNKLKMIEKAILLK